MNDFLGEIFGCILLLLCFLACVFCVFYALYKIVVGDCQEGYIDEIRYEGRRRGGIHIFGIYIKTNINFQETRLWALESFTSTWVYRRKWERLKRKYVGKKVHIYINPKNPYSRTITRELSWRLILPISLAAVLLFVLLMIFGIDLLMNIIAIF
ncbi:MAG: hypothetical protein E7284_03665 [Lachnospiraceae bacterium]|nr:hypothetical protein [Lachnospiraceae bacterium]